MPYATAADVQERIPQALWTVGATSQPTETTVGKWLSAASSWIDGTLRWKYAVPVTDTQEVEVLRDACADLVAARVWAVLGGHGPDQPHAAKELRQAAYQALAYDPKTGYSHLVLPDTTTADDGEAAVAQPEGTFTDPDDSANTSRFFTMDSVF